MYRLGAGFDFVVMETRLPFNFHRSVSGSTEYKILGAREELRGKYLRLI